MRWLKEGGLVATLIKPQFEVGPSENVRGVVKSEAVRQKAVNKILVFSKEELGLENLGVVPAAIKGPKATRNTWPSSAGRETDARPSVQTESFRETAPAEDALSARPSARRARRGV